VILRVFHGEKKVNAGTLCLPRPTPKNCSMRIIRMYCWLKNPKAFPPIPSRLQY
jgi:hypothetical protein